MAAVAVIPVGPREAQAAVGLAAVVAVAVLVADPLAAVAPVGVGSLAFIINQTCRQLKT